MCVFNFSMEEWDLTIQQILPHIDGITHVAKIANKAEVDASLVKAAIQNLHYHQVVEIVPIFMYQNVYVCEPKISELRTDDELREEFMDFIKVDPPEPPTLPVDQLEEGAENGGDPGGDGLEAPQNTDPDMDPAIALHEDPPVEFKDIYR